ncbi:MAG: hypothetical protein VKP70_05160 [Cyanobacteriota bacterium]|nr:hypothetical protein [Cyanobacteriota bacterium]
MTSEDLYISLCEEFSPTAEYLQADSKDRAFLAETAILAGLAFALSAFAASFFGHLGERASQHLLSRINGCLKISQDTADRDAMLEALDLMCPFLKYLDAVEMGACCV